MLAAILGLPTTQSWMRHLAVTLNIMGAPGRFYARGDDVRISVHFNPPCGLGGGVGSLRCQRRPGLLGCGLDSTQHLHSPPIAT